MKIGDQIQSGRYGSQTYVTSVQSKQSCKRSQEKTSAADQLREQIRNMQKTTEPVRDPKKPIVFQGHSESVVSRSQKYMESVHMERMNTQKTEQTVKKMKYNFKDVSSKIIRSKTSLSAKQVVGQAKREVTRLKRARASGNYDEEEISAAIAHARTVERVAKKKAKHLEQEELATAASRGKEQEERLEDTATRASMQMLSSALEDEVDAAIEEEENLLDISDETVEEMEAMMESDETMDLEVLSADLMDDMMESYEQMMEDLGLEELETSLRVAQGDMTPDEIRMMKVEHRNKEVRDLLKADMEYLKAMFDRMEKQQQASGAVNMAVPGSAPAVSSGGVESTQEALARVLPSIDISM